MKSTHITAAVLVGAGLAAAGFLAGKYTGAPAEKVASVPASGPTSERKVLYWHDPMVPGPRFDKPGKSPFMDMQLVPVYADEQNDTGVKVSAGVQQNLGIRTAKVIRTQLASSFDAVGTVQFDERLTEAVQTRVNGYVERLLVRATMEYVRRGQPLAVIYAPDWLGPQNEYLALKRAGVPQDLVDAARDRMRAMSIPDALIRQSEQVGAAQARFSVPAPVSGVVAELGVREGVAVTSGMTLFRIAGLERVWAVAEVPEVQAVRLRRGQKVKAALQADASQTFDGELQEILPQVSANTRTVQARFEVANRAGRLTPGMLLRLQVAGPVTSRLVVPAEAVIRTGTRAVAIVRKENGSFEPRDIALGADLGDQLEVVQGLGEGDQVVASGQFLVDSEARLKSVLGGMAAAGQASGPASSAGPEAKAPPAAGIFAAQGKVESVDPDGITISHGPVPELKWPGMTMGFSKPTPNAFPGVKAGDMVSFQFKQGGPMGYELVAVQPAGAGK
ncbi:MULTISPECIES: efflux RND transporter periplasmic adaptor subunit [Ramlibacter]|uniref:Efflux RND transporter periplasmic adaptor subunit n=1 Tax=Ramlibacter aquaticus TaxID=2780094 RepID=A0ABR9SED6_9BURK|nr:MULTISPECIES: efflux RND transporter periplasmic adaptor subunit [Ramlibacter]MBE7940720.1 efflux RND transporter periplasmic adaptor subunit [Ramlibacter aquaticus]